MTQAVARRFPQALDAEVITVDVVGGLLRVALARPDAVHRYAQELLNDRTRWHLTAETAPDRLAAEQEAAALAAHEGRPPQAVSLAEIYRVFARRSRLPAAICDALRECEVDALRRAVQPDADVLALVQLAIEQGRTVVLLYDGPIPRSDLETILADIGLPPGVELLLSHEGGRAARDGGVWAGLARDNNGRRVHHIGDAAGERASLAAALGISTFVVDDPAAAFRDGRGPGAALNGRQLGRHLDVDGLQLKNVHRSLLVGLVASRMLATPEPSAAYAVGYGALGPLCLGFAHWLHLAALHRGCDRIVVACDAAVMVPVYLAAWGDQALPCARLSMEVHDLVVAGIGQELSSGVLDSLLSETRYATVGEVLERFRTRELEQMGLGAVRRAGVDPGARASDQMGVLRGAIWRLETSLVAAAEKCRQSLRTELEALGIFGEARVAVVELGWGPRTKNALQRVVNAVGGSCPAANLVFSDVMDATGRQALLEDDVYVRAHDGEQDRALYRDLVQPAAELLRWCLGDRATAQDRSVQQEVHAGAVDFVRAWRGLTDGAPVTVSIPERDVTAESMVMLIHDPTPAAAAVLGQRRPVDASGASGPWLIGAPVCDAEDYRLDPGLLQEELEQSSWPQGFRVNLRTLDLG